MSDNISITRSVALYIAKEAATLFHAGAGAALTNNENIDPQAMEEDALALIDNIPGETDEYYWANALLQFARFVHGIVDAALNDETENPTNG